MQLIHTSGFQIPGSRVDARAVVDVAGLNVQHITLPAAYPCTLTIRTSHTYASFNIPTGHELVEGDNVDVYWPTGVMTQGYVDGVDGQTVVVDFAGASGVAFGCQQLPIQGAACVLAPVRILRLSNIPPTGWETLILHAGSRALFMLHVEEEGEDDQFLHIYMPQAGVAIYGPQAPRISTPDDPVESPNAVLDGPIKDTWGLVQVMMSHAATASTRHSLVAGIDGGVQPKLTPVPFELSNGDEFYLSNGTPLEL